MPTRYLTAKEAAAELNIALPTLYAYVSRGLIRSEPGNDQSRSRRYYVEDVRRLKERKQTRHNPDRAAERALDAGSPVLESAITLIAEDSLYYRGHNVQILARQRSVEEVAALIWTGNLAVDGLSAGQIGRCSPRCQAVLPYLADLRPLERCQAILPLAAVDDLAAYDLQPAAVAQTGGRILHLLTLTIAQAEAIDGSIVRTLQQAWTPHDPVAQFLLSAALILCADHELNASTFTARCAASTGSNPYAAVSAGLAALQGFKHGTASEQVEAFFREVEGAESVRQALANRLKRGDLIPGYGHVIYREVDPRARLLHQLLSEHYPTSPALALTNAIIQETDSLIEPRHNIDFMLATLARALHLPDGSAPALFGLGRTIGWVGHIIEQYQHDRIIRPRARYTGQRPLSP